MKRKHLKYYKKGFIFAGFILLFSVKVWAVGTLIPISSTTYNGPANNTDRGSGVAVDERGNIIVTGRCHNGVHFDYCTIKYNNNFSLMLASISYNGSMNSYDIATGIVVDNNGNIIVTGYTDSGVNEDYCTIKYNNDLSHTLASAIYNGPENGWDEATGVTVDNNGNIIVTGYAFNGLDGDCCTIKYNNDLSVVIASYTSYNNEQSKGITTDRDGNIIVAGICYDGMTNDYWIIKYNNNLSLVLASATYNGPANGWDAAYAVALDGDGNIIVTGYVINGANEDYCTIKYNNNLSLVLGLATYNGSANGRDCAYGVVVDKDGNIIVSGTSSNGTNADYCTIKYNNDLSRTLALAIYNGPANGQDEASGVTVDSNGNIIVTGYSDNGVNHDYFTIKYNGSPRIFSVSPASTVKGRTFDFTINGLNFFSGAEVSFSGEGIIVNSINFINSNQLRVNITVTQDAPSGRRDVTVTNIDESSVTLSAVFEVRKREVLGVGVKVIGGDKGYINIAKGEEATIYFKTAGSGEIKLRVYTLRGQLVWKKTKETDGEEDFIIWNGKNSEGTVVASGVYVIYIEGPGINTTKKIAVIK